MIKMEKSRVVQLDKLTDLPNIGPSPSQKPGTDRCDLPRTAAGNGSPGSLPAHPSPGGPRCLPPSAGGIGWSGRGYQEEPSLPGA